MAGDGLGEERFAAAGRSGEQDPFGGANADPREQLGMVQGPFDRFDQPLLDLLQAADVVPADVGHLDEDLPDRRGLDLAERGLEVGHAHYQRLQGFVGNLTRREIERRQEAPEAEHRRLAAQGLQIGSDKAVSDGREMLHIDVVGQGHPPAVDFQDLAPAVAIGNRDGYLPVESSRPPQRGIKGIGQIGRGNDDDVMTAIQAVEQGEQLRDDPLLDVTDDALARGAMASISSMKMMLGARLAASSKILRR